MTEWKISSFRFLPILGPTVIPVISSYVEFIGENVETIRSDVLSEQKDVLERSFENFSKGKGKCIWNIGG